MTPEVKSQTYKGLKAFVPIAENPGSEAQLPNAVSAILAPDALTAMQKRSGRFKPGAMEASKEQADADALKKRSSHGGRRKTKAPAIDVKSPTFSGEIKTTHEMANEVSSILGAGVLGALKASCDDRKEQEKQQQQQAATAKLNYNTRAKSTSRLTPEMAEATNRSKAASRASVAPQSKKAADDGEVEDEEEEETDRHGKSRRRHKGGAKPATISRRAKTSDDAPPPRTGRIKKPISQRRAKSFDDVGPPKRPGARRGHSPSRPKNNQSRESLRHQHQKDFANHAVEVGIDLEDGMELFDTCNDEKDKASKKDQIKRPSNHRVRKPRRDEKSTSVGGAAPGRRGRNGRRGGGTRLGNIKKDQARMMTAVDQTKQFREEDYEVADESEEDDYEEEQEDASVSSEDDGILDKGRAAAGVAVSLVGKGAGAAVDVVEDVAGLATAGLATAGGAVFGAGGAVLGVGKGAGGAMLGAGKGAGGAVLGAGMGVGTTVFSGLGSVATSMASGTTAAASAATMSLRGSQGHQNVRDEYSDDEDDEPEIRPSGAGEGSWGFTGGGMK